MLIFQSTQKTLKLLNTNIYILYFWTGEPIIIIYRLELQLLWQQAGLSRATLEISFEFPLWNMSRGFYTHLKICFDMVSKAQVWNLRKIWSAVAEIFNNLYFEVVGCHLHFKNFSFWYGPLSLSSKLKEELISGCWYIQLFIFWNFLP